MASVGTRLLRKEDPKLLTGEARFVDDLVVPGAVWLAMARSPFGHARLTNIDTSEATSAPGVRGVYTGADLRDLWAGPMPCAWPVTDDMKNPEHIPVAVDKVNFLGEIVAVVVADSRYEARDALEKIVVDYEPLDAVVELEDALSDRVVIHDALGTNKSYTWALIPDADAVDRAFSDAAHTVSERYIQQRLIPEAMEPRGVVSVPSPMAGEYTLYSATQIPHILKIMVGATLGIPEQKVRVIAPAVGGGFGSKLNVYAEELIAVGLSKKLGIPDALDRGPHRERGGHHPGPRPDPGHRAGRRRERQDLRGPGEAHRRHGGVPPARHPGHPAAGGVPVPRRLRHPELLLRVHVGVHQQDAHRRLPGCRAARGDLRNRAGHRLAGP